MSAADPIDPRPPVRNGNGDAAVIDISTRVTQPTAKGRWKEVSTPRPGDESDSRRQLADHIETTFNEQHLTLSDDDTAAAYTITLGIVRSMLQGARARGVVSEEQLADLDAVFEGMLSAPRLV